MCGIGGIYSFGLTASAVDNGELARISKRLAVRGPDGSGEWFSPSRGLAFAHRRLSILDLSDNAAQPMTSADGRFVITFNGEIYNYRALRTQLEGEGARFRTTSDTEVLLQLYARHGSAMLRQLRGMFAFAIWDERNKELFLARDPYGIKPLYTASDGKIFRFASQVKALLAGGGVSHDADPAGVVSFHLFGSVSEPYTLYREISTLPAGHMQRVDERGVHAVESFSKVADILARAASQPAPIEEVGERVRTALLGSARAHLVADVEVGVFLSAGVDSGALLGLMRDADQRNLRAITLAFDEFQGSTNDEVPLAAKVAAHYRAEHIVRRVDKQEFDRDLSAIIDAMDQPSIDGVNTWFVAKAAKEAGLKVAISGLGGDELLAGYSSFVDLPRWRRRFGPLAAVPGMGPLARNVIRKLAPDYAQSKPKALGMLEYADSWAGVYLLRRGLFLPYELADFLDRDLLVEGLRRLNPLDHLAASLVPDPGSDVGRVCALESTQYMRNQLLRDADWAGMAHGVEIRVPLVDAEVLKSLASVIPILKPGAGKAALANAPSRPLLAEVVQRSKTGFTVPTGAWMASAAAGPQGATSAAGLVSRRWSRFVFAGLAGREAQAHAA